MDPGVRDPGVRILGSRDPGQTAHRAVCGSLDPSAIQTPPLTTRGGRVPRPPRDALPRHASSLGMPGRSQPSPDRGPEPHGLPYTEC